MMASATTSAPRSDRRQVRCRSSRLEVLGLARIGGGKSRDVVAQKTAHPDAVLLIDGEMKRPDERVAGLHIASLADDPPLRPITLGKVDELVLPDAESPHVAARRHDDALHQPKLAVEGDAFWWRQRLTVLVEDGDGFAAIAGEPHVVVSVDGVAESTTLHSASGEAGGHRRKRATVGGELGGVALL